MAIVEVTPSSAGVQSEATGTGSGAISISYRSIYRVQCDDPLDMPKQIYDHFRTTTSLPWPGRTFSLGNGDDRSSICKSVRPTYVEKSNGWWNVECSFEAATGPGTEDPKLQDIEGKESDDPTRWHDLIEAGYTQRSQIVEKATFRGFLPNTVEPKLLLPGMVRVPCNSALTPFDPGLEEDYDIGVLRITKFLAEYDGALHDPWIGTVNSDLVNIVKPAYKFKRTIKPFCGRMMHIGAEFDILNGFKFYRLTIEVWINPFGWRRVVADRGVHPLVALGDELKDGTTLSSADVPVRFPYKETATDWEGYPITEPVDFDGRGAPISPTRERVSLIWQTRPERAWAGFRW